MMARMDQTQINGASDPDRSDPGLDAAQTPTLGLAQTPTFVATPTPDPTQTPDPGLSAGSGLGGGQTRPPTYDPDPATPPKIDTGSGSGLANDQTQTSDQTPTPPKRIDWIAVGMWSVIILLNVLALALASSGQVDGTWRWAGLSGDDSRKWLLPGITEVGYIGFLLLGADALRREQSPFIWWACAGGVASAAVFMNSVHGDHGHKVQQGLIFGVASAVSLAMTFAKFLIDYRSYRRKKGHTSGLRPRAITVGSLRFLRTAVRASLIVARCERVKTKERAYELADMWRWIYQDTKVKHGSRTAKRAAWIAIYRELGQRVPDLNNILVPQVTFRAQPPPQPEPAIAAPVHVPSTVGAEPPPPPRSRRPAAAQPAVPAEPGIIGDDSPTVVLERGRPAGTAGVNWMPLDVIVAEISKPIRDGVGTDLDLAVDMLPTGLDETTCECRADVTKRCGKSVLHHVQRRGQQLVPIMRAVPDWAIREKRISNAEVLNICKMRGKEQQIEITGLFDHLRKMAQEQAAARSAGKVVNGSRPAIEAPPDGTAS